LEALKGKEKDRDNGEQVIGFAAAIDKIVI